MNLGKYTSIAIVSFVIGCNKKVETEKSGVSYHNVEKLSLEKSSETAFSEEMERNGSLMFGSRMGVMKGMDDDVTIELGKDGRVVVWVYSVGPLDFYGSYSIIENQKIIVDLKGYNEEWPVMTFRRGEKGFLLYREDGITAPSEGHQKNKYLVDFWPFAEIEK